MDSRNTNPLLRIHRCQLCVHKMAKAMLFILLLTWTCIVNMRPRHFVPAVFRCCFSLLISPGIRAADFYLSHRS